MAERGAEFLVAATFQPSAERGQRLERRAQFTKRYAEERRKLEEQLRKELEEKRQPLLKELVARLKGEFSAEPPTPR